MKRFVEGEDRRQGVLLPEHLDDWVSEENPVRAIDVFVDALDLGALGFEGVTPAKLKARNHGIRIRIRITGTGSIVPRARGAASLAEAR